MPNTNYALNIKAVNMAGVAPSIVGDVIQPSSSDGMYVFI